MRESPVPTSPRLRGAGRPLQSGDLTTPVGIPSIRSVTTVVPRHVAETRPAQGSSRRTSASALRNSPLSGIAADERRSLRERSTSGGLLLRTTSPSTMSAPPPSLDDRENQPIESDLTMKEAGILLQDSIHPEVSIETTRYQALIDDPSISDKDKETMIRALWIIVASLVELGFSVSPAE